MFPSIEKLVFLLSKRMVSAETLVAAVAIDKSSAEAVTAINFFIRRILLVVFKD